MTAMLEGVEPVSTEEGYNSVPDSRIFYKADDVLRPKFISLM